MAQAYKAFAWQLCSQCDEEISEGDIMWKKNGNFICECCYEDNYEYDHE